MKAFLRRQLAGILDRWAAESLPRHLDAWARTDMRRYLLKQYQWHGDPSRITIAPTAVVNNALFIVSSGRVTVGEHAMFSYGVKIVTGVHDYTTFDAERVTAVPREGHDVVIEDGVWIATDALVLGPCRIGRNAVVAAGSVVTRDVPPYAVVAGVPARVVKRIQPPA